MFPLVETIKILDGQPQNLSYHQHRFEASYFKLYKQLTTISLKEQIQVPGNYQTGLVKLRFLYNQSDCFCQYDFYEPKPVKRLKIVFADDIDYALKWVNRKKIDNLLQEKALADDILIIKNQRITDTSFTNIVFWDGGKWVTPKYPLLHGTARARLLNEQKITAEDLFLVDLNRFKSFKLINALRDFDRAEALPIDAIIF